MTIEDIVYDILEIVNALEDDHDIEPLWLMKKITAYREALIIQDYMQNETIRSNWIQKLPMIKTTKVTSADDLSIVYTSISLSKAVIPSIISLPDDMGLVRVTGSSGILPFDHIGMDSLMMKVHFNEEKMGDFGYVTRLGNGLYMWPLVMEVIPWIIASDPMAIPFTDPVTGAQRDFAMTDQYPVDPYIAQQIVLEICTKDLKIEMGSIADITNDSKHQLRILQSGASKEQ